MEIEHRERVNLQEYTKKISNHSFGDPMLIKTSWKNEVDGMRHWPKLYFMDISRYFSNVINRDDLYQRLECEYKEGKAYRYFANGFIGEVFVNQQDNNYVIMKTKCVPSQRVSSKQYDVWAIITESGKITAAYCTCTAGLLGMHVN